MQRGVPAWTAQAVTRSSTFVSRCQRVAFEKHHRRFFAREHVVWRKKECSSASVAPSFVSSLLQTIIAKVLPLPQSSTISSTAVSSSLQQNPDHHLADTTRATARMDVDKVCATGAMCDGKSRWSHRPSFPAEMQQAYANKRQNTG